MAQCRRGGAGYKELNLEADGLSVFFNSSLQANRLVSSTVRRLLVLRQAQPKSVRFFQEASLEIVHEIGKRIQLDEMLTIAGLCNLRVFKHPSVLVK